jgi:hypothetical protein
MLKNGTLATVCLGATLCLGQTLWVSEADAEDRIGPFEIDTPNDSGTLGVGFASQVRGEIDGIAVAGEDHEIEPSAQFARMRLLLRGKLLHDRSLKMGVQLNMVPGALELLDVWSQYRFHEQAKVRVGIFKTPFTVHRAQSFSTLVLADWGLGTRHFGAERQLGAMVHNFDGSRFRYAFGVFTGENTRAAFANRHTGYYGDIRRNPSDLTKTPDLEEPHPELFGQVGWGSDDINLRSNSDAKKEGFRYHVSASAAYDIRPTIARDMQLRVAGELLMKWEGVSLNGVFYAGFSELSEQGPLEGFAPLMFGPQAELAYRPIDEFEVAARYSWVQLTQEFRDDARGRADTFIDEASEDDLAAVSLQYADAGLTAQLHEVTGGVNVYFIGHSLKWQTDGSFLPRQFSDVWFNDWRVRTQLQLAF